MRSKKIFEEENSKRGENVITQKTGGIFYYLTNQINLNYSNCVRRQPKQ